MTKVKKFIKDWIFPIAIALILAILINKFIFFNRTVPTVSMVPTIQVGDKILSFRNYTPKTLQRGDIILFHNDEVGLDLVKRLIGLPGEKVNIEADGSLYINDVLLDEPYVKNPGGLPGIFNIPENHYLFLGDNRANSGDAREWKNPYIPYEDIMGEAKFIIYPFTRIGKLN